LTHSTELTFRDKQRDVEFEYEGDGVIVWWFTYDGGADGMDGATDAEQQSVYDVLWAYLEDWWRGCAEDVYL